MDNSDKTFAIIIGLVIIFLVGLLIWATMDANKATAACGAQKMLISFDNKVVCQVSDTTAEIKPYK